MLSFLGAFNPLYSTVSKGADINDPSSSSRLIWRLFTTLFSAATIAYTSKLPTEERILFPGIEEATGVKGIMDTDIQEHAAFHDGLENLKTYIDTCLATPSKYSGVELIKVLDSFGAALHSHLLHEPANLLALSKYSFDMKALGDHTTQYGLQRYSTTDVLPVLWYNLDTKFEDGKWESFPPLPAPVKWYMVNVLGWWRGNWWRFASCSAGLVEKELLCLRQDY
ncbi:hypothetical protein DTO195F2_4944 [Paecilomyces variotii]|nr:hypothetical protein DTO195F2_4944 [Paecilomyces variotii]KAJ9362463.1 hypothetical protein DTO027B9_140 [Paecilomyces variotii]